MENATKNSEILQNPFKSSLKSRIHQPLKLSIPKQRQSTQVAPITDAKNFTSELPKIPLINSGNCIKNMDISPKISNGFQNDYFVKTPGSLLGTPALKGEFPNNQKIKKI